MSSYVKSNASLQITPNGVIKGFCRSNNIINREITNIFEFFLLFLITRVLFTPHWLGCHCSCRPLDVAAKKLLIPSYPEIIMTGTAIVRGCQCRALLAWFTGWLTRSPRSHLISSVVESVRIRFRTSTRLSFCRQQYKDHPLPLILIIMLTLV